MALEPLNSASLAPKAQSVEQKRKRDDEEDAEKSASLSQRWKGLLNDMLLDSD